MEQDPKADGRAAEPPWGRWVVIGEGDAFKVKKIEVLPGERLSYQKHSRRQEHWYVVSGKARVILDGAEHLLDAGGSIDIGRGALHRIENPGRETVVVIEVQTGEYFGEDDVVRIEDDYGRI